MLKNSDLVRKLNYYYQALTLINKISNWYVIPLLYFGVIEEVTVTLNSGQRFHVTHYLDFLTIKEIFLENDYFFNGKEEIILDIGGNIGTFSVLAALKCPHAKILTFEPAPKTFQVLQKNLRLNKCTNVKPFRLGLAAREGVSEFYTHTAGGLSSTINSRYLRNKTHIKTTTLSTIFRQHKIRRCGFAKIDCEGAEFDIILKTPAKVLQKIQKIALEYHDNLTPNHKHVFLVKRLKSLGFKVRAKKHPLETDIGIIYAQR